MHSLLFGPLYALYKYDSDQLITHMNYTDTHHGHGRLVRDDGETQYIGGSIGGESLRAIDDWMAPDWR